jgi:transglutaminase-like putative cysteine protease
MRIHAGYEISYNCGQPTPMITMLSVHPSQKTALITPDLMRTDPAVPAKEYLDGFGNLCHVIHAPAGNVALSSDFLIHDSGSADEVAPEAQQHSMENLPVDTLFYLLGSRYCETDRFIPFAWAKFGDHPKGWSLVQAICDYVHGHIQFGYEHANSTKTAWGAQRGALRCVPRLCAPRDHALPVYEYSSAILYRIFGGYRGASAREPMDFSAWFEVFLGERWYTFDARHNVPRIGRILMARGRDATDAAISTSFGPCQLINSKVVTQEVLADKESHPG